MAKTQDFNKHAYVKELSPISQEDQSETTNKTSVKWIKNSTKSGSKPTHKGRNDSMTLKTNQNVIDHMSSQLTSSGNTGPTPN